MPKINVYLPDDLAETVKELNIPVSAICQRALEVSVKRLTSVRGLTVADLDGDRGSQLTERLRTVIRRAAESPVVTTAELGRALVEEGANLGLDVLRAIDIDPRTLRFPSSPGEGTGFAQDAVNALELAVVEAMSLGHNYVGCEHLLLGIIAEPDGKGGEVLREHGADLKGTRRAVQTALAGIVHLKKQQQAAPDAAKVLQMIMTRLDRLEKQVGIG
ncbi:ATP-dependent Clp protease ATP-binding subunit ClpC [Lentzea atacamensis]|uniref:ATP-dependent Clp protease ATP-binding subunit ClpC n=1 Tax=Lentzea atacamensis TaxID=531938 RepID=A0A316HLB6_9PSEU|nr:Clp protease N-terminal domain-containing protein [Lentzea atacamensis]PWK81471.1 ATP-dependent Clp protease ATP-binding subunit ClpC [Lentzea atacamensis]RAS70618.1 ATP-dependent Clp protease ATP-binding subunit ClpC [Lentzea atacamensis]